MHRKTRLLFVALSVAFALVPAQAFAWTVQTTARSASEIRTRWQAYQPAYGGTSYAVAPRTTSPYVAGSLQSPFLTDGVNMVNFVRYLAGLPDDVRLDSALINYDQHGTVVLAANGKLDHYPTQPAGMTTTFYTTGKTGTSSSNLARGPQDLESAVKLYMGDSDAANITRLGHRRWILNPPMAKTGMGQTGSFSAMWATDKSRTDIVSYNTVNWPAAGEFPVEFFKSGTAWSVSLNPAKYAVDPAGLTVTLRRVSDGRTWTFNSADTYTAGEVFDGEIFSYSTNGYGIPSCVIFRPPLATTYAAGDQFDVTVGGTLYVKGTTTRTSVNYRTSFISLDGPVLPSSAMSIVAPAVATISLPTTLSATLKQPDGRPIQGRSVAFERSADGGLSWAGIASGTTDASGNVSASWVPGGPQKILVRARFGGDAATAGSLASTTVAAKPYVLLYSGTSATRYRAFSVGGYLRPRHGLGTYPATVRAYLLVNGAWVYKTAFRAKVVYNSTTTSRVGASVTLPAGRWMLKMHHAADANHVAAYSAPKYVTVR